MWVLSMIKGYLISFLLLLPNIVFSSNCSDIKLSDYLMDESKIIVSFKVINSQFLENSESNFIDIEVTKAFFPKKIENVNIRIDSEIEFGPTLRTFEKDTEWLAVLSKFNNSYFIAGCASTLIIENGSIIGDTGIEILHETSEPVSVHLFELALNAFQQGISLADQVCKRSNSYCTERATYDIETGVLSLPSVEYEQSFFGFKSRSYAKAKLEKVSEDIKTFVVTEIE